MTLALFEIRRPYALVGADNIFAVRGRQRNRGAELTVNGRVGEDLNLFGGVSLLDPKLVDTDSPLTSDKQILGLARRVVNLLAEYRVPFVRELTVSIDLQHVSSRPGNSTNTDIVDGYTVVDLGARYQADIGGTRVAFRVGVNNVFDQRYWANIAPTGQNGYNGIDNGTGTIGAPRAVRVTAQVAL